MSWKFPKRKTRYDSPIDADGISDTIHELTSEVGKFNEHNFSADSTINNSNVQIPHRSEEDAAVVISHTYWTTSGVRIGRPVSSLSVYGLLPYEGVLYGGNHRFVPPFGPRSETGTTSAKLVSSSPSWQSLKSVEGTAQNSTLWILCSFQMIQTKQGFRGESEGNFDDPKYGADGDSQYALRLNGSIIWETATMSASESGDPYANRELHGPASIALDALVPVTAGPFTLELVGRSTHDGFRSTPQIIEGDLMAIEFRR